MTMPCRVLLAAFAAVLLGCQADRVPPHEEPPDTTQPPAPAAVSLTELPDSMTVGDTAAVTGALLDADGDEIDTQPSAWAVKLTGVRYVSNTGLTNVVRAAAAGTGAVRYTHVASGLVAEVTTQISALPDTTAGQVGEQPPDTVIEIPEPVGDWPDNEPDGMSVLTHVDGSSIDWPGWNKFAEAKWHDTTRVRVVADPDSKYGHAIEKRFHVGDASGWGDPRAHAGYSGAGQTFPHRTFREVYVRYVFKLSSNWEHHAGGDKLWLSNNNARAAGTSFYIRCGSFYSGGHIIGPSITTRQWLPIFPDATHPAEQLGPCQGAGVIYPRATRGVYHTVEVLKHASDPGVANGWQRVWIDGVEYTRFQGHGGGAEWNDVSLADVRWIATDGTETGTVSTRIEAPLYWGGQNDVKKVDDWIRISEIHLSVRN